MTDLLLHLTFLYGVERASQLLKRVEQLLVDHRRRIKSIDGELTERDSLLITYGDQVQTQNEKPLQTLNTFCRKYLTDIVSGIHILPFYPWTSDDGFSVVDYHQIDPTLGDWNVVSSMQNFRLMFDGVINHISAQSAWFKGFLRDDPHYRNYFIVIEGEPNLSRVVRPRALPLLTTFQTSAGEKNIKKFLWKWVLVGTVIGFAMNVLFVFLLSRFFPPHIFKLATGGFIVSFVLTGIIVGVKSPGVTLREPAIAGLLVVILDWIFLRFILSLSAQTLPTIYLIVGLIMGFLFSLFGAWIGELFQQSSEEKKLEA